MTKMRVHQIVVLTLVLLCTATSDSSEDKEKDEEGKEEGAKEQESDNDDDDDDYDDDDYDDDYYDDDDDDEDFDSDTPNDVTLPAWLDDERNTTADYYDYYKDVTGGRGRHRRTTTMAASTRAFFTFTPTFSPEPEFCVDLLPIYYVKMSPGDPPNRIDLEWSTPELLTVSIVGTPFTRSTGFTMQARLRNTTIPVGVFPDEQDATIYDCPPGTRNTARKQIAQANYFYSMNWRRPLNVSTENIEFVVCVLKPFSRWYKKTLDLPPFPETYPSAEITKKPDRRRAKTFVYTENKRQRIPKELRHWKVAYEKLGVRYDGGRYPFPFKK